ncbi:MAG TPA: L,D-transpeptidase [Gemmatimonadaceae bacterium]|nr:L,D-transpeptidase [Gemmatimonadaceae bacterium]
MIYLLLFWLGGLIAPTPLRIVVNLPAYRLDVFVDDSLARTIPIAVGMVRFPTPRGSFVITSIEWNPWWIPPDSPWAAREKPTPPGPTNPMGRVKLNFRPLYFLHGTPTPTSIGSAASHGCIRLRNEDAIALARLVHHYGTPGLGADAIDAFARDTVTTREIPLEWLVPIEVRYDLVEITAGRVTVYRDVYGLSAHSLPDAVRSALAEHGVDTARVDETRLRGLVRRLPRAGRSMSVDSLLLEYPRGAAPH